MTRDEIERLVRGEHHEPHRLLGAHLENGRVVVRVFRPEATAVVVLLGPDGQERVKLDQVHPAGLFEGKLGGDTVPPTYRLEVAYDAGAFTVDDPYRFLPTIGELDQHLLGEGRHERLWQKLGAHEMTVDGVAGTAFGVWAPNARAVRVVGDFNSWDGRLHPMRALGSSGIWELFLPGVGAGDRYKYELVTPAGALTLKADPVAFAAEKPPRTASVIFSSDYTWGDQEWMAGRDQREAVAAPMSTYEVHLGSWRHGLSYRELAEQLPDYVAGLGFTHVEFMPVAEHPYAPSWGYQVSAYYAPTARFGTPDDLRHLIDQLHQRGIGVLVDWVPAHFPKDAFALARFDGTALYEHEDPRRGEHPDWGSLVFNFGRNEVRNFLVAPRVGRGEHDAVGARRGHGRERERVGLERERALRVDQLILVPGPSGDTGHEQLPHPGSAEQSHRMQPAIPAIELAHHAHGAGVGRPDRERRPGHAVKGALVGAELLPEPLVGGLADQVLVDLPDGRPEPVGVVDGEAAVPVGDLQPVGGDVAAWKHDLEQAGRVDLGQRDPVVADQGDHPSSVRPPGPDRHPVAVQVRPKQAVRLMMLPTDQPLDRLAFRGDGGHGQLPTVGSRQRGMDACADRPETSA
jgi:hypothetical protein